MNRVEYKETLDKVNNLLGLIIGDLSDKEEFEDITLNEDQKHLKKSLLDVYTAIYEIKEHKVISNPNI